ncbi:glycoside hydrolase/deacetylase [Basidiobolus meristosporus CBS 931.73]|uniref:Glycoside hydrolase/deacetylase n=1 Tax=Basidiobolus meristosporus CBS 931.73 TaxID=1314790 RepID=A0A1Y1XV33_9FUNG|nr:glycoside hydrolase/deacetylase [Basidiobolus meristosporus CBS 931.73]|eukprot:ORX89134.1 glycoside hydrolase/deacetylase [Basidiobolus meristosporus CBS 931.73]
MRFSSLIIFAASLTLTHVSNVGGQTTPNPAQLGCGNSPSLVQCQAGYCCSKHGFCGATQDFCQTNCLFQCDGKPEASKGPAPTEGTYIHQCNVPGTFAMTFDDGPHLTLTPKLLDVLKSKNVKVTFFVLGNMLESPASQQLLKRAYDEGHHIASHTYDHISIDTRIMSPDRIKSEMNRTDENIFKSIGKHVRYMRPPTGAYTPESLELMKSLGYQVIYWNLDSLDWKNRDSNQVREIYVNALKGADASKHQFLALHHDIHPYSVDIAAELIDMVTNAGFRIVTVPECLGDKQLYKGDPVDGSGSSNTNTTSVSKNSANPNHSGSLYAGALLAGMMAVFAMF